MWAVMGYNFFYVVYDFFLTIFRWLGLAPSEERAPYPSRGSVNLLFLLLGHPKNPIMKLILPLHSKYKKKLRD
jgi:hypothetical protein